MAQKTVTSLESDYQETQRVAGKIEHEVSGVKAETSRHEISLDFSFGKYLPPEAVDIAQREGYELHAVFGHSVKFRPGDQT
jgi:hypothetical protein